MKYELELNPPLMPNFITFKAKVGKKEDGFKPSSAIPISDLTEEQAIEYAELMKQTFINHWKLRKSL